MVWLVSVDVFELFPECQCSNCCGSKLTRAVCFAWTSPQTRGWCTIWSTASQSRCFPLQASRCLHTPLHQRSGTFLHWCRHTWRSFASRLDRRSCYTTDKNRKLSHCFTLINQCVSENVSGLLINSSVLISVLWQSLTISQSWLSQCGAQSLSPQGWMASGLSSPEHWFSGTTRPSGALQYTWRTILPWPHDPEHCK